MCLDPMYMNQVAANYLMREAEMFGPAFRLVEFRIKGQTQGVYLLLENMTDTALRSRAGVASVLRRDDPVEVKFPDVEDAAAADLALAQFDALAASWSGVPGGARLEMASSRLELYRFLYYTAFNSLLENADWGDEPYFVSSSSSRAGGSQPVFRVYGWDADDILKGACDHPEAVIEDSFGLLGCAEHALELALFDGRPPGGAPAADDEVYALYVDVLERTLEYFSEAKVAAAFERTGNELKRFAVDPAITAVMPDWRNVPDAAAAIDERVEDRKAAFRERRNTLVENLAAYRESH
jgi:hypothetical protein